ncbi:MAG: DUF4058 family protein [Candidatus Tectomicrobia bacterium]|nr:DUF4058 family protein [Candidatus Tectomicrobia bacterium]
MPLLDHFHPPLHPQHHWESFHSNWATRLADALNDCLPEDYIAEEQTHTGTYPEIDVATFEQPTTGGVTQAQQGGAATLTTPVWMPPAAAHTMPAVFPDSFEVRVFQTTSGLTLVGAIELISPANKDRPEQRRAFANKCASYLHQGVSLIIIDIVTNRRANLHNEIMKQMDYARFNLGEEIDLYGVAYRPVMRHDQPEIDIWLEPCAVGEPLPTMALRLTGDLFIPVDFDSSYMEACRRRRLV